MATERGELTRVLVREGVRVPTQVRGVGGNVAALRKARGFTQEGLAQRANVSTSLLSKVEQGKAPASPAFIGAVARALRVDVPRVTGQPYDESGVGRSARLNSAMDAIRRAIATIDIPDDSILPRPRAELARDVVHVSDLGKRCDYVAIGETLPVLLGELAVAIAAAPENERPRLQSLLAEAFSGASALAGLLGYLDLRDRVYDRIHDASAVCDDPLRKLRADWQRTMSLQVMGAYGPALTLMDSTRRTIGEDVSNMDGPTRSMLGSTHLRSSVVAARAATTEGASLARQARDHLTEARRVADVMGADRDDYGLAFGPSNVTLHEVSVAVDLEDGPAALDVVKQRGRQISRDIPASRRGHYWMDVARAYVLVGDREKALRSLQHARRVAPQLTRHHPQVRETALAIASSGRTSEELTAFISWLGLS